MNQPASIHFRFNPQSCQDVLDVCCLPGNEVEKGITPPPPSNLKKPGEVAPPVNEPLGCGIRNVDGIDFSLAGAVHGEAGFGEFPWTIALLSPVAQCLCGGSLIHPSVVLTGAHCVFNLTENDLKIRAGEWDTQTTKERLPYQERGIRSIVVHPDFKKRNLENDVVSARSVFAKAFLSFLIIPGTVDLRPTNSTQRPHQRHLPASSRILLKQPKLLRHRLG